MTSHKTRSLVKNSLRKSYFLCGAALTAWLPMSVNAQSALLEEIVVTAQKRSQSIQDVGISITAFSGEQVKQFGLRDSTDVARLSPGVSLADSNGGLVPSFSIRGVTQQDFSDQGEGPNATYIDEGYIGFGNAQAFGIYDLERVEILKGPQGTLFGRNATGGLVHFITRKPTQETEGFVDLGFGSFGSQRFEAALSGPLSETVSGRVAVYNFSHDNILDNDFPGTTGLALSSGGQDDWVEDTIGARGHLLWEPSEGFNALLSVSYGLSELSSAPYFFRNSEIVSNEFGQIVNSIVSPIQGPLATTDQQIDDLDVTRDFAFEDPNEREATSVTAKLTWELNGIGTLTSITDYKDFNKIIFNDADGSAASGAVFESDSEAQTIAQELRLNGSTERLNWVTGLYYLNIDNDSAAGLAFSPDSTFAGGGLAGSALITSQTVDTESFSIFGQFDYEIAEDLSLTTGLRIIREEKDFIGQEGFFANPNVLTLDRDVQFASLRNEDLEQNDTLWSGKIQLDWTPTDNILIYSGINRGVKAGNFNAPFTFGAPLLAPIPYEEEELTAFEVGLKSDFADGNARFNVAAYYYDYSDYQVFIFDNASSTITNNDAEIFGLEFEFSATPSENFEFSLTGSFLDTTVEDVQISGPAFDANGSIIAPAILRDSESTFAPGSQFSAVARYTWQNFFNGNLTAQVDYQFTDERFVTARNFDNNLLDSFNLWNARVAWTDESEKWEAALSVQNLADERYVPTLNDLAGIFGGDSFVIGRPRWVSFNVRYNF